MALPVLQRETALWDPFREFADLHQRMGQLMQSVLGAFDGAISAAPWSPLADVEETDDAYLVQIDLPGVRRDDVTVEVIATSSPSTVRSRSGSAPAWCVTAPAATASSTTG